MQVEQNNSKENQENKTRSLVKKLSFLWVILGAASIHLIIKIIDLGDYYEMPILITIWAFVVTGIIGALLSLLPHNKKWDEMLKNSELHVIETSSRTAKENEEYLLKKGVVATADVGDVMVKNVYNSSICGAVLINYYNPILQKNVIKKFFEIDLKNIPKIGDKIEILYEKNHPENSMILCEKPSSAPWYKLQKKYKIKIINN